MLCHTQSNILNVQGSNALGATRPTVSRYVDFLEKSYVLDRVEPKFSNIKKGLLKAQKYTCQIPGCFTLN